MSTMRTRRSSPGYSLIEVMTAVAVMTVGATGIVLMQGASTRANQDGYESTVATTFGNTWVERIKRDALLWTQAGAAALANTSYLNDVTGNWYAPNGVAALGESCAADYNGYDLRPNVPTRYIANLRNVALDAAGNARQVTVRVSWPRSSGVANFQVGPFSAANPCAAPLAAADVLNDAIRTIYISTVVHYTEPRP